MVRNTMVLYPGLSVSHFLPMIHLTDKLMEHGYAITVAFIDPAVFKQIAFTATVDRIISSRPAISFHRLPLIDHPPATTTKDGNFFLPGSIHTLIVDFLSVEALDIAERLNVPGFVLNPSNAGSFAIFLQLPWICKSGDINFRELGDTPLEFSGLPPLPASHLYEEILKHPAGSEVYNAVMDLSRNNSRYSNGFLVNTFESLEARVVNELNNTDGHHCETKLPTFYCIGQFAEKVSAERRQHECLTWLDGQPEKSVVFLCFGSTGLANLSAKQLMEIAVGLEKSGQRFIWVVPVPPPPITVTVDVDKKDDPLEKKPFFDPSADPDLDALLPTGFLERTSGRGVVVKLWAPQVDVLGHRATGAFVTHCGWNSVLEGVIAGVPMLCWPLHAEQRINKVLMVEEMGVGVEMVGWQQGLVKAEEVEAKLRLVMESEVGNKLREQVMVHREAAAAAWTDRGSSRVAFARFLSEAEHGTAKRR
uniref:Glycosyltransferase n=1 Tax=Leersia perrieri TaxID=77586 RepID=A0A0D9XRG9_9ORYZ